MFPTSSFLQIPPRDGHPCFRLYPSHYRADSGLAPVRNVRRRAHCKSPAGRSCRALPSHIPAFRRKCLIAILHSRRSSHRKKWDKVWAWVPSSVWAPAWEWVPALHQHRDRQDSQHRGHNSRNCCSDSHRNCFCDIRRNHYCSIRRNRYCSIRTDVFRRIRNCCSGSRNYLIGRNSIKVIISINSSYSHLLYSTIC